MAILLKAEVVDFFFLCIVLYYYLLFLTMFLFICSKVSPLFQKLESEHIESLKKRFGGQQVSFCLIYF